MSHYYDIHIVKENLRLPFDFFKRPMNKDDKMKAETVQDLEDLKETGDITLNQIKVMEKMKKELDGPYKNRYGFMVYPNEKAAWGDDDYYDGPIFFCEGIGCLEGSMLTAEGESAGFSKDWDNGKAFYTSFGYGELRGNHNWVGKCFEKLWKKFKADVDAILISECGRQETYCFRKGKKVEGKLLMQVGSEEPFEIPERN